MKKLILSLGLSIVLLIMLALPVLAAPGLVTNLKGVPSNTSISLTWTAASSSTSTLVRFSTTAYPTTTGGADGTTIYSGALNYYKHTGLTAGTVYYYSVWGYDGALYSATPCNLIMNTASASGDVDYGDAMPTPTVDTNKWVNTTPTASNLSRLEPFYSLVNNFSSDWGMPANNGWLGFWLFVITFVSIVIYIRLREIFIALACSEVMMVIGCLTLGIPQWMVFIPIIIGLGIWSIERSYQ